MKHTISPDLIKQLHPTKNGLLNPYDLLARSHKRVHWKCYVADDHEWVASVKQRSAGNGCPMCRGSTVVLSNCLGTVYPELAKQFHLTKNGSLTSCEVHSGSHKRVYWKCHVADDHEWKASVSNRVVRGSGCPFCSGAKVTKSNCLTTTHPELAKEWHKTKNGNITPNDVGAGSSKKIYWQCPEAADHVWQAEVRSRSTGGKCPACLNRTVVASNCLAATHPGISKEWHDSKNHGLTPFHVTLGSQKKVWWTCLQCNREWKAAVCDRTKKKSGCPHCVDQFNSKGIRRIDAWLTANGVSFIREKSFADLKSLKNSNYFLKFDFFLNDLNILIEFDGEQHFKPQASWGGEEAFNELVENDRRKDLWVKEKGYTLIRIRFDEEEKTADILSLHISMNCDVIK